MPDVNGTAAQGGYGAEHTRRRDRLLTTTTRSITMATRNLTADDTAHYTITFAEPHGAPRTVRAAYIASEADWLVFKDHEHRTVAQVNRHLVVMVERSTPEPALSDEDRIRGAMTEAQEHPGRVVTR